LVNVERNREAIEGILMEKLALSADNMETLFTTTPYAEMDVTRRTYKWLPFLRMVSELFKEGVYAPATTADKDS
jgi:hypothetical protein